MNKENIWREITIDLIQKLGGIDNIKNYLHCATRFRVEVYDDSKVDENGLKEISKAKGVNKEGEQWQVIFGAGIVDKVYKDFNNYFIENAKPINGGTHISETKNNKIPWWNSELSFSSNSFMAMKRSIKEFSAIFIPLIPMFIAGGLALALNSLVTTTGLDSTGLGAGLSRIFDVVGGSILGLLPVLVAWSTMKRLGGPEVYGIGIGLILISPSLLNSWGAQTAIQIGLTPGQDVLGYVVDQGWATIATDGSINAVLVDGVMQDISSLTLPVGITVNDITANVIVAYNNGWDLDLLINLEHNGGYANLDEAAGSLIGTYTIIWSQFAGGIFTIKLIGYQAQVFSAIFASLATYGFYRLFNAYSPEMIAIILVPLATILISTWTTLWVLGPLGRGVSNSIAWVFLTTWKYTNFAFFGLGGAIMAFMYPLLVVTGLHQGFTAVEATIIAETTAMYGEAFTFITAVGSCTNVAVGGAVLGYSTIVKSGKERSAGLSTGITANLGITEPALFGSNLDLAYPMVASMIGAAMGGYFVGMTGTYAMSLGSASWIGLVQFNTTATTAYSAYVADNALAIGYNLQGWSPMLKEAIALTISLVGAFSLTVLFSQTKWGEIKNKERGVEVYQLFNKKKVK